MGDRVCTYAQLERDADRLAAALRRSASISVVFSTMSGATSTRACKYGDVVSAYIYLPLINMAEAGNFSIRGCLLAYFLEITAVMQAEFIKTVLIEQQVNPLPGGQAPLVMLAPDSVLTAHSFGCLLAGREVFE